MLRVDLASHKARNRLIEENSDRLSHTVDSQKIVYSIICGFTENRFLRFLTLRIGRNMESQ